MKMSSQGPPKKHIYKAAQERRRYARIPVLMEVLVRTGLGEARLLTSDLARGGLFIRTDAPAQLRELVEVKVEIDDGGEPLDVVAVVRHRITPREASERGVAPGMGVQFYGMSERAQRRWEQYSRKIEGRYEAKQRNSEPQPSAGHQAIRPISPKNATIPAPPMALGAVLSEAAALDVEEEPGAPLEGPASDSGRHSPLRLAAPGAIDKIRRRNVRYKAEFRVRIPDMEKLHEFLTQDISSGGVFLSTDRVLELGSEVRVHVMHPDTEEAFPLDGEVVRISGGADTPRGVGIRFLGLDEATKHEFEEFVVSGLPDGMFDVSDFLFDDDELDFTP